MKKTRNLKSEDPTLGEFYEFVKNGFKLVYDRLDNADARMIVMDRKITKLQGSVADVQDDLATIGEAVDRDALTVVKHENRIERLEKCCA
jgi:hypothetical protein